MCMCCMCLCVYACINVLCTLHVFMYIHIQKISGKGGTLGLHVLAKVWSNALAFRVRECLPPRCRCCTAWCIMMQGFHRPVTLHRLVPALRHCVVPLLGLFRVGHHGGDCLPVRFTSICADSSRGCTPRLCSSQYNDAMFFPQCSHVPRKVVYRASISIWEKKGTLREERADV